MESHSALFLREGLRLVGVLNEPDPGRKRPAVLFLHGIPGSEKNVDIQRELLRRGVGSFSLHFRGAWGSEGTYRFSSLIGDARAALKFLASRPWVDTRRLAVFGFSMGGWTAINLAAEEPRLLAVAAVAPVGGPEMVRRGTEGRVERLGRVLRAGPRGALGRDFVRAVRRWDPAEAAGRLRCPLLLVHGTADELVPLSVSKRILASAPGSRRLVVSRGAGHSFLDRRAWLARIVAGWLERRFRI